MKDKGQMYDTQCHMGCSVIENPHHVFIICKAFNMLREDACQEMLNKTRWKIEAMGLDEAQFTSLLQTAKFLFSDCPMTWPLHHSFYYLGHILKLNIHVNTSIFKSKLQLHTTTQQQRTTSANTAHNSSNNIQHTTSANDNNNMKPTHTTMTHNDAVTTSADDNAQQHKDNARQRGGMVTEAVVREGRG
jgi:hypothetical protein